MCESFPASEYQKVLVLNATGKFVSLNSAYRIYTPVTPQILNAFLSDEAFLRDHSMFMHGCDFLPMPVTVSPLVVMLKDTQKMVNRYTTSYDTLHLLRTIVQCFALNPHLSDERILAAKNALVDKTVAFEEQMYQDVAKCQGLEEFMLVMEQTTLYRIHLYEACVHAMFDLKVPLASCLTPSEVPKGNDWKMDQLLAHFFETKERIRNVRAEKALPEDTVFEPVKYFHLPPPANVPVYKNFFNSNLAREYFEFLK